jgi:hypothetical protein
VLAQLSADPRQDRFPLAIFDGVSLRDGDISVRLKPVSGREEQSGGVVFRYRDEKHYYLARANARGDDVVLSKVENGRLIPIKPHGARAPDFGVKHDIQPNSWHILKVSVRGDRFARAPDFGVKHDIQPNSWHILKVSVRGDRFQVYLNHRRILQGQDSTFQGPGKVGLWTIADSITYFDDFRVYPK